MAEMVASVKEGGIIQPIVVRPINDCYEIVCGERRYRAAREAGLEAIPAVIKDLTDEQAIEMAFIENLQREDVNAMQEAKGFKAMLDKSTMTVKDLALKVGKPQKYILDRVQLLGLHDEIKEAISSGMLSASHGIIINRLNDPDDQIDLFNAIVAQKLSIRAAENALDRFGRKLDTAQFDTKRCEKCPHNGAKQKELFDGDTNLAGRCLNAECFDEKAKAAEKPGAAPKTRKAASPTAAAPESFNKIIEDITDRVRRDSNLSYMRILASGILASADIKVKLAFMRRRDSGVGKNNVDKEISKYIEKLTDFFIPGFCVELIILNEDTVKEGFIVHKFRKAYDLNPKASGKPAVVNKEAEDALKLLGKQISDDEKKEKKGKEKK
jgi:ParB family chromosome partitioning protein